MIRVGVVGYGLAGRVFHVPLIAAVEGLELAAVVERSGRTAEQAYPGIATYSSLEAMLDDTGIELIVIATPPATHVPLAQEALRAGRHVVVDKPVAPTSLELAGLMSSAAAAGRLFIPFHNRRWDSDYQTLQKVMHDGALGRVVSLESTFDRWKPGIRKQFWKEDGTAGGGHLLDIGTHLADQSLHLFGMPEAVLAIIRSERDEAITDDTFTIHLRYPGKLVTISSNCLASLPRPRFLIRGTRGNFVKWGLDPQEDRLKQAGRVTEPDWGMEPASAWGKLAVDVEGGMVMQPVRPIPGDYRKFYAGVRDALLGKTAPPVLATDALRVAQLLEWARQSSNERREILCNWDG
jgi:scyllo-inositol 2-dehydrogenase (NADP+)